MRQALSRDQVKIRLSANLVSTQANHLHGITILKPTVVSFILGGETINDHRDEDSLLSHWLGEVPIRVQRLVLKVRGEGGTGQTRCLPNHVLTHDSTPTSFNHP